MKRETIVKANKILEKMDECENILDLLNDENTVGIKDYYSEYGRTEKIDREAVISVRNYYKNKLKDLQDELEALKDE